MASQPKMFVGSSFAIPTVTSYLTTDEFVGHYSAFLISANVNYPWVGRDQEYYWGEEWQAAEREVDEEYCKGESIRFNKISKLIDWLKS